ncbi:DUF3307 domain-containing protein [Pararhizobium sp.]|uniref:DUF3307 domain-containing protein n=1 Tax=Pararhizobium sp. TaxID=1977563 RepID=UPI0027248FDD|nr:DUF3307 domain-containing protein [Pararhizobium sp.]MDO9416703.1 DUF3307 domain-containing protein [Pararhizobium sp.]
MQFDGDNVKLGIIALLLLKHWICDFTLQTPYQIRFKKVYGHPGGLLHAAIHVVGTACVLVWFPVSWPFIGAALLGEFVLHYHIDWLKEKAVARLPSTTGAAFWALFGFDQLLHHWTYVGIVLLV